MGAQKMVWVQNSASEWALVSEYYSNSFLYMFDFRFLIQESGKFFKSPILIIGFTLNLVLKSSKLFYTSINGVNWSLKCCLWDNFVLYYKNVNLLKLKESKVEVIL